VLSAIAPDKPPALLETGLFRARFCETLGSVVKGATKETSDELFLVGLFSVLDALLDMPLEEAVRDIGIPERVKGALLGRSGPYHSLLELVLSYERGQWDLATQHLASLGIDLPAAAQVFVDSVDWSHQASQTTPDARWSSKPPSTTNA
jgi:EAL and modified HD-GYP domain-containing signal transduction protein